MEFSAADGRWMRRALILARRGFARTAPNPMVGAVLVRDGTIVGEGWHAEFGAPHAEAAALSAAGERARGATAYVTLEPCTHQGQTPPCVPALIAAGVVRVVFAATDPNPVAGGGGEALRSAGIGVDAGLEADEARELNAAFHHRYTSDRPFVTLKLAVSLDGAIADASRRPGWMTGDLATKAVHHLRAGHDAIAVGSNTAIIDDPQLTVRGGRRPRVPPRRIVFDRRCRLPVGSKLVRTAKRIPTIVVTADPPPAETKALEMRGVTILGARTLVDALRTLKQQGVYSFLCEGGAALAGAFLAAGAVDRMVIFQAPVLLGAGGLYAFAYAPSHKLPDAPRWRILDQERLGEDVMTTYAPAP
jgi:diaminohydroxyphosphoribosylaminopyrimidine deaminase/5-amino-6-(5-phosphoribosylamino)uracil reductase